MIYDFIIVWWWAAWLFASISADKSLSKLILEKNKILWIKVLLSGWERANVSNMDIEPTRDYFGQNRKAMIWIYNSCTNWDMMAWFAEKWVSIVEEDRGRLILESWDSKELLWVLKAESKANNTTHYTKKAVSKIAKINEIFTLTTDSWEEFKAKNVAITVGWRSFMHTWTVWDWYSFAESFGHSIIRPHRWLCWLVSREDFSEISWVSTKLNFSLRDKKTWKEIYWEFWPLLFTHFGVSWPILHNSAVALWEYLNSLEIKNGKLVEGELTWDLDDQEEYIKENIIAKITFNLDWLAKSVIKFFNLTEESFEREMDILNWRSWKEAKITWWWVKLDELTNKLESKKVPGLYFAGEVLDITGKTWGFNLQLWWSSGALVWKSIKVD